MILLVAVQWSAPPCRICVRTDIALTYEWVILDDDGLSPHHLHNSLRLRFKRDGTRAEIRFRLSPIRAGPFKSVGASVQSTADSRGVRISDSNAGYTMFRGSVKSTDYPLLSPVFPSLPLQCVTVCHHISTGLYPVVHASLVQFWKWMLPHCFKFCLAFFYGKDLV